MVSLRSLVERVDPEAGQYLAWLAERGVDDAGERTVPKEVTGVERHGETIRVSVKGPRGGRYHCDVEPDGESTGYHVNQRTGETEERGPLVFAELTDSDDLVEIRRGFHDTRTDG